MAETYRATDRSTGLDFFRSANTEHASESYLLDNRFNAAFCRLQSRWLKALVDYDITAIRDARVNAIVQAELQTATKLAEACADSRLGKPHEGYETPERYIHLGFVAEHAVFLEEKAAALDRRADRILSEF